MARQTYGGGADDVIVTAVTIDSTQVAGLPAGVSFQVWNLANALQLTSILDEAGAALPSNLVVTDSAGKIPVFQGPDGYTGPLRLKHTVSGVTWILRPNDTVVAIPATLADAKGDLLVASAADTVGRLAVGSNGQVLTADSAQTAGVKWAAAAGGGVSMPNTLIVAANGSGITGDYQCDGTADDVQINAALAALRASSGGAVVLTAGVFNLAAPLLVEGFDDVDTEQDLYVRGQGPKNTTLAVGSGVNCGIRLGKCVRAHVWDLGLTIFGASDGIQAVRSTVVPAGGHRSAWMSTVMRVQVIGPFDGTDTGWGIDVDSVFRSTFQDIEINGTTNGMRWLNGHADFNGGDSVISRCFVDIGTGGAGGVAYGIESTAGNMNQLLFQVAHGIGNPAVAQTCWKFSGAGATSHVRTIDCNAEQFATTVQVASTAYDIDVDLVHVTMRNGSVLADLDGYGSRVRCGLAYVEPSATVTLVDDDNGYAAKPNIFGPIDVYADTGSTVNADTADTLILRDITYDGPGTVTAAVRHNPAITTGKIVNLTDAATIATDAALGEVFRVTITAARTFGAPTNPADGQRIRYEVGANGAYTPVFATGAGAFAVSSGATPAATAAGSFDTFDCVYSATANRWRVLSRARTTA